MSNGIENWSLSTKNRNNGLTFLGFILLPSKHILHPKHQFLNKNVNADVLQHAFSGLAVHHEIPYICRIHDHQDREVAP